MFNWRGVRSDDAGTRSSQEQRRHFHWRSRPLFGPQPWLHALGGGGGAVFAPGLMSTDKTCLIKESPQQPLAARALVLNIWMRQITIINENKPNPSHLHSLCARVRTCDASLVILYHSLVKRVNWFDFNGAPALGADGEFPTTIETTFCFALAVRMETRFIRSSFSSIAVIRKRCVWTLLLLC